MMTKINRRHLIRLSIIICHLSFCMALTSCDDYLTDDPRSQIAPEEAYNTIEDLKRNALLSVYNYIGGSERSQGLQGTDRGVYDLNSITTDEQIIPVRGSDWYDGGLWQRLFFHKWTAGEAPLKDTWDYLFKVVMLCNEGIEHVKAFKPANMHEQDELDLYEAELRAVRAMYYYYLMDLFGRVPIVTSTDVKSSEMTLSDRKTTFYWIFNELSEVVPQLKTMHSQHTDSEYYGRVTAFVGCFLMMKLAINAEVYTDNDWTDNVRPDGKNVMMKYPGIFGINNKEKNAWETVKDIYSDMTPYFELSEEYDSNFSVNNESSKENIFVIPMNPLLFSNKYVYFFRSRHYSHGAALHWASENGPCATVSTMREFGFDGDVNNVDFRFYYNFYYDYVTVNNQPVLDENGMMLSYQPLAVTKFDLSGEKYEKTAGARIRKYQVDQSSRDDGRMFNNDIVLFRFSDMVLMFAEACYRLGENKMALDTLNSVYGRSNSYPVSKPYEEINDDVILHERLMEFVWEGWRRNDLIRFRRFNKPYDLKVDVSHETDGHTTVFPIPADLLVMHPNWKQNPGY